jgi:predicted phage baseplate assembly protein
MNPIESPIIREHACSEEEIFTITTAHLKKRDFMPEGADPMKDALVRVFARYCEILIERLNRVPESHHRAFLRMLGATPVPALPAQVPLSFKAASGTASSLQIVVPKFTQVSAPGDSEQVVFETIQDLPLVQAELALAVAVDTRQLIYADVSTITSISPTSARDSGKPSLLAGATSLKRVLHIGQRNIIGVPNLTELKLKIDLDQNREVSTDIGVEWSVESDTGFIPLEPKIDTTKGLTRSGEIIFVPLEKWPSRVLASVTSPWLTCRLRAPASGKEFPVRIIRIEISACTRIGPIAVEAAYNGSIPLDVSRDFFPLGERPRFGDVFYFLSESLTHGGSRISIDIKLTNPAGAKDSPIPAVSTAGNPGLLWECYTTQGWVALDCTDSTRALTQDGEIQFTVPDDPAPTTINGMKGGWVRGRLIRGSYIGNERSAADEMFHPMAPPSIATIQLTSAKEFGPAQPENLVVESNFEFTKIDPLLLQACDPFPLPEEQGIVLYLGLKVPDTKIPDGNVPNVGVPNTLLAGRTISLYNVPDDAGKRMFSRDTLPHAPAAPRWQVRTATGWRDCAIDDHTQGLNTPGMIDVHMPEDTCKWHDSALDFQQQFLWLRVVWNAPEPTMPAFPRRLLLNTVPASQTLRLVNEILGSSNGKPGQIFQALRLPIVGEVTLQVREPGDHAHARPGAGLNGGAPIAVDFSRDSALAAAETWISWSCVEDFSHSDSHSRDFLLDRLTGSIRFGDGRNGRIPPPGPNNIRLHEYHTGGGTRGNRPAETATRLHTTVPYVESVTNYEPAQGGQDTESLDSLSRGATARLRHRDRAVCSDDYADLARKASPEVAYAKCVSTRDLLCDPVQREARPGVVSVIIVPHSSEPYPQPSYNLVRVIKAFLDARRPIGVDLIVLGPEYVSVGVVAEIAWAPGSSAVGAVAECEKRLCDFLHPLTGGPDGCGWRFGQLPHASDIYSSLGAMEGLDHIRTLKLQSEEKRPGLLLAKTFLVCSGKHEVRLC